MIKEQEVHRYRDRAEGAGRRDPLEHTMVKTNSDKKRLPRRPVEETRRLMLAAAVRVLLQSLHDEDGEALGHSLAHIRVTDVVEEASRVAAEELGEPPEAYRPFSIGALYQIWPNQAEFQAALLLYLARLDATVYPSAEMTTDLVESGLGGTDLIQQTLADAWTYTRADPVHRALLGAYTWTENERVRAALAAKHASFFSAVSQAWSRTLRAAGRRVRSPYTEALLARSVAALIEGFSLQWLADRDALADPEGDPEWDLATRALAVIIEAFTEPVDSEHP
jgi:hypothetical protein